VFKKFNFIDRFMIIYLQADGKHSIKT